MCDLKVKNASFISFEHTLNETKVVVLTDKTDEFYTPALFSILEMKVTLLHDALLQDKPEGFHSMTKLKCDKHYKFDENHVLAIVNTIKQLLQLAPIMNPPVDDNKTADLHFLLAETTDILFEIQFKKNPIESDKIRAESDRTIEKIRYETLKFTVWTGVAVIMATAGMLAKGFHWF